MTDSLADNIHEGAKKEILPVLGTGNSFFLVNCLILNNGYEMCSRSHSFLTACRKTQEKTHEKNMAQV